MHQAADQVKQEDLKTPTRRSLPVLGKVTAVALCGQAIAITVQLLITSLLHGTFDPGFFIIIIPILLVAGFVVSRVRWALSTRVRCGFRDRNPLALRTRLSV